MAEVTTSVNLFDLWR